MADFMVFQKKNVLYEVMKNTINKQYVNSVYKYFAN